MFRGVVASAAAAAQRTGVCYERERERERQAKRRSLDFQRHGDSAVESPDAGLRSEPNRSSVSKSSILLDN